jgi:hypothetical protein
VNAVGFAVTIASTRGHFRLRIALSQSLENWKSKIAKRVNAHIVGSC